LPFSRGKFGLVSVIRRQNPISFSRTRRPHRSSSLFSRKLSSSYFLCINLSAPYSLQILSCHSHSNSKLRSPESAISRSFPRSTISAASRYHILLYQEAQIFVRLAIETKGYSQVMPLIVENSQTMSSHESRSVKRPSESASCILSFAVFFPCCVEDLAYAVLCFAGFFSTTRSIAQSRSTSVSPKHSVFLSLPSQPALIQHQFYKINITNYST
jgi:hypothetical protein